MRAAKFTCPCCGYRMFTEPPGSYEICKICFWEDDALQLRTPSYAGGANTPSLITSQKTFRECGAMEPRFLSHVRKPTADDVQDPDWHPFDAARDVAPAVDGWPDDLTELYYWRRR